MKFICDVFYWNSSKKDEAVRAEEIVKVLFAIYKAFKGFTIRQLIQCKITNSKTVTALVMNGENIVMSGV